MSKAVFAGCARSCAKFLDGVLANIEALGATYDAFEVVIVENDSSDDTRRRLRQFAETRPNVRLIEADGLDQAHPKRGDRLAVARNIYMAAVREPRYADCDDLVVLDFDDVNRAPVDVAAFKAARRWLWQKPERRGVFANATPFYYDIWALRHPTWCPGDCWSEVRAAQSAIGHDEAVRRFVANRQISIAPNSPPIPVDSAFAGLGIYRRAATLDATYVGLQANGEETCDHVAFNADVKGSDGVLAIFPALQTRSAREHIVAALRGAKMFKLEQDKGQCALLGPSDSQVQKLRAIHPLLGRRFPDLAGVVSRRAPKSLLIDGSANIGDTVALARLAGARMPAIAITDSLTCAKFLWENIQRSPVLFGNTRLVLGSLGRVWPGPVAGAESGARAAGRARRVHLANLAKEADVALFKAGGDGHDREIVQSEAEFLREKAPILWLKARTASKADEVKWQALLKSLSGQWPNMILFDEVGFAIAAGTADDLAAQAVALMGYARRQRERIGHRPTLGHIEIALFPPRFDRAYDNFRRSLSELS